MDTSTRSASVAIMEDDTLLCEFSINNKLTHSQKLMLQLESILKISGEKIEDIDLVAVCVGPGSFTGIRIGLSAAKAIAQVRNIPMIAVSSLELAARNFDYFDGRVFAILDAQRDRLYYDLYEFDAKTSEIISQAGERVIQADDLFEEIKKIDGPKIITGEGLNKTRDRLEKLAEDDPQLILASEDKTVNKASNLAGAARLKYKEGKIKNFFEIEARYIRKSQAEIQMEKGKDTKNE